MCPLGRNVYPLTVVSTINPTKHVGLVQSGPNHLTENDLVLSWYSWKIAELALKNNHSNSTFEIQILMISINRNYLSSYWIYICSPPLSWVLRETYFLNVYYNILNLDLTKLLNTPIHKIFQPKPISPTRSFIQSLCSNQMLFTKRSNLSRILQQLLCIAHIDVFDESVNNWLY